MQVKITEYADRAQTSEREGSFRETEFSLIPGDWKVVGLGQIGEYVNGFAFKPTQWKDKGLPIIRIQNLTGNVDKYNYFDGEIDNRYLVQHGDLLISWSASLGVFLWKGGDAWLNQHIFKVTNLSSSVSKMFLYYLLQHYLSLITRKIRGTTMKHITKKEFVATPIPVPPLPEQRKIAKVLGTVQRAIEQQDKIIEATKNLKKSLMQKLFTQGLYGEEQKETEIGLIPKSWEVVRLGELFHIQQGKAMSPKSRLGISPHPFLRTVNVLWGRIDLSTLDYMDFTDEEITKLCLRPSDLLVCEGGEIGRTAIWRGEVEVCGYQNHIHRLRKLEEDIRPEFCMYWMQAAFLIFGLYAGEAIRTTIPNLSGGRLKTFSLPKPSEPEQKEIAHILSIVDKKIEVEERRKATLDELFKTILHKLMTGEIRLKDIEV